jgi:ElaB/YqjD/DUF883 family membrane-anchored ribosome-binding protein
MADTFGNPNGGTSSATGPTTEFERSIARHSQPLGDDSPRFREKINEDIGSVKEAVQDVAQKATDTAAEIAEKQKSYAAEQIGKLAGALQRVGKELKSDDASSIGGYAAQLGASAQQFAEKVKDKNFTEIASVAEDFGRRQPLAFLGIAAVAGLAASRFLMASKPSTGPAAYNGAVTSSEQKETYNG